MAPGHEPCAALAACDIVRKPEQLDVEGETLIDDRVAVQPLRVKVPGSLDVDEVMVNDRSDRKSVV